MRPLFIDREGVLSAEPPVILAHNEGSADRQSLAEYAVKNLNVVRAWPGPRGLRLQFRPERIGAKTLARLVYFLWDGPDSRVLLNYFRQGWHHELVGNSQAAIARILALVEEAKIDASGAVLAQSVDLAILRDRNPLHDVVQHWKRRLGWRDFASFMDRACEHSGGRYVLFEHDRDRHAFVFRDFGAGIPEWAKHCLAGARGLPVENLHDDPFGIACTLAYRQTLEKFSPALQVVDAKIRWPQYGTLRSCYWRLMLPIADPAGKLWLLSASLADTAIDLRHAG